MKVNQVVEGLKDPKDNPCWKGYHPVGTKKKNGKTVPNCVPKESVAEEIGYDDVSPKSASYILRKMEQGVPMSNILDDFPELSRMMDVIAGEHGLHPDDDFEEIENILMNDLEDIAAQEDDFGDYDDEEDMKEMYGRRRSSYGYNPDRDAERAWDAAKRGEQEFRNRERNAGLEDEEEYYQQQVARQREKDRGPWYLKINGKIYKQQGMPKSFDWKSGATKYGQAILKNKPELLGKIYLTKKPEDDAGTVAESKTTVKVPVTQKPRQGPLKPQTGAGKHKDKKKDAKQGKEKHKKPMYETGTLKVAKDDDKQTILQNPATGVQTQIDKTNPNAPRLAQDEQGKLKLQMPQGGQTGGTDQKQNLVGKDVSIDSAPVEAVSRIGASPEQPDGEITDVNPRSPISGDEDHDEISKLLNQRLRKLAGL